MTKKLEILDLKDRKILSELDKNSRKNDSEIAKAVGISKQVANFRIQKLIKEGIVENFYTIINIKNLGLNFYYIFFQLKNLNKEKEVNLLDKIRKLDYVGWLVSGTGRWDIVVGVNSPSVQKFEIQLNEILNLCENHLHEYIFTTLVNAEHLNYKFLSEKNLETISMQDKNIKLKLDNEDKKILKTISQNARLSIVEISSKTKLPVHVVNYHLKNMIRKKIIDGFKPKLNLEKIGYEWHLLLIELQKLDEKRKKEFLDFCRNHKKIYYFTSTLGKYNIMIDIHVQNVKEFKEVLLNLKENFSDIIKTYDDFIVFEEYKIDYLPNEILN